MEETEDRALAKVQLASADEEALAGTKADIKTGVVEFKGEKFHVAEKIGAMPLLEWAAAADTDTEDPAALASILRMLEDVIHEDEWKKFRTHARKVKADADELLNVINAAMEIISGTPTEQPAGSSGSPTETSGGSTAGASPRRARSRS
jgi:hypothetical protein